MAKPAKNKDIEAKWLSDAMDAADIGPKDLAAKTGLDANWISQWKIGNRPMTDIGMLKIGRALKVSPYEVRPTLQEYADFFRDATVLDGLSKDSRRIVEAQIAHLRRIDPQREHAAKVFAKTSHLPAKKA